MISRSAAAFLLACGAATLVVRCGGTTETSAPPDAGAPDGTVQGAADAADGASDATPDDGSSSSGFDSPGPCTVDAAFPPESGATFACGANECYSGSEYCLSASGGAKRGPSIIGCQPFLECGAGCADATPSCACTSYAGNGACTCADDGGDFFVSCAFP
jgi:hypothetical protein